MRMVLYTTIAIVLAAVTPARADLITFDFSGTLVSGSFPTDDVSGEFTLDLTTLTLGSAAFTSPIGSFAEPSAYGDDVGSLVSESAVSYLNISFYGANGVIALVLQETSDPTAPLVFTPDLVNITSTTYVQSVLGCTTVTCLDYGPLLTYFASGTVTEVSSVPEPGTLVLAGAPAFWLVGWRLSAWHTSRQLRGKRR